MPSLRVLPPHGSRLAQPLLALVALVALFLFAAPALAVEPPRLDGAITDRSGVIADETEIRDAFAQLYNATNTQMYVLYLPTTDGEDINDFIDRVADANADLLTPKDALLVVATDDRRMSIRTGEDLNATVDQNELDQVRTEFHPAALGEQRLVWRCRGGGPGPAGGDQGPDHRAAVGRIGRRAHPAHRWADRDRGDRRSSSGRAWAPRRRTAPRRSRRRSWVARPARCSWPRTTRCARRSRRSASPRPSSVRTRRASCPTHSRRPRRSCPPRSSSAPSWTTRRPRRPISGARC